MVHYFHLLVVSIAQGDWKRKGRGEDMLRKLESSEVESLKKLSSLGVYENLELKGIVHKRRTVWAQVYDRETDGFYELQINRDNIFRHRGKRVNMNVFC